MSVGSERFLNATKPGSTQSTERWDLTADNSKNNDKLIEELKTDENYIAKAKEGQKKEEPRVLVSV